MANVPIDDVVNVLHSIYNEEFGGKTSGRFRLTRGNFRQLCGRKRLEESTIAKVVDAALEQGLVLTELGDHFCVCKELVLLSYRPVPKSVGLKYIPRESQEVDGEEP